MRGVLLCRITFALSLDVFFSFSFPPSFWNLRGGEQDWYSEYKDEFCVLLL